MNPSTAAAAQSTPEPSGRPTIRARIWAQLRPALPALTLFYAVQAVSFVVLAIMSANTGTPFGDVVGNYDANWYAEIAEHGYRQDVVVDDYGRPAAVSLAFFPLYPGLVAVFTTVGVPALVAELLVTLVAGGIAAWGLYAFGNDLAGRRVGILLGGLWAIAPGALALRMGYSESLFVALVVWTLVALHRRQWLPAAMLCVLAGLTRSTAAALIGAVGVVALVAIVRRRDGWRPWAAVLVAPLGLVAYLLYVGARAERLDGWFWLQSKAWYMGFDGGVFTWETVESTVKGEQPLWVVLITGMVVAAVVLLVWSFFVRGISLGAHLTTAAMVASALGTSEFWQSRPRFLLPAVTLAVPVALLLAKLPRWALAIILSAATVAGAWFGGYLLLVAELNP